MINRKYEQGPINELPVDAGVAVDIGHAVATNASGYLGQLDASGNYTVFQGFVDPSNHYDVDNTDGSAGDKSARVLYEGKPVLGVTGATQGSVGASVYAYGPDDFDVADTRDSGNITGVEIGYILRVPVDGQAVVNIN